MCISKDIAPARDKRNSSKYSDVPAILSFIEGAVIDLLSRYKSKEVGHCYFHSGVDADEVSRVLSFGCS